MKTLKFEGMIFSVGIDDGKVIIVGRNCDMCLDLAEAKALMTALKNVLNEPQKGGELNGRD